MFIKQVKWRTLTLECPRISQNLITDFLSKTNLLNETDRFLQATELARKWQSANLAQPLLPALPAQQDYWYLSQVAALGRHVDKNGIPYVLQFEPQKIDLPFVNGKLWIGMAEWSQIPRQQLEQEISILSAKTNNPMRFISLSEWLLLNFNYPDLLSHNSSYFFHIDGYRMITDEYLTGLLAGNVSFGGSSFIDSFWLNKCHPGIKTLLVRSGLS